MKNKRLNEKDLLNILENKNINISNNNKITLGVIEKIKSTKINLTDEQIKPVKKSSSLNINKITQNNKEAIFQYTTSKEHLSLTMTGARLISVNQIFSSLQNPKLKLNLFSYKKTWHNLIKDNLFLIHHELIKQTKELPFFDSQVEIIIFRQAPRLVDEDALATMFKFIIDALKRTKDNPYGILADDNPKIVHKITAHSDKGDYAIGIKVKRLNNSKESFSLNNILDF